MTYGRRLAGAGLRQLNSRSLRAIDARLLDGDVWLNSEIGQIWGSTPTSADNVPT